MIMNGHEELLGRLGSHVEPHALKVTKARLVVELLQSADIMAARLLEVHQGNESEAVVMEVDVEVGQQPRHDIRQREQIVAIFDSADTSWPEILALRSDFPRDVPHLNLRRKGLPPSLCLSEQPYSEGKLRWTPVGFIESIRSWLSDTARNELHRSDQPLEPFLMDFEGHLIIPNRLLMGDSEAPNLLYGYQISDEDKSRRRKPVYRLFEQSLSGIKEPPHLATAVFHAPPRQHGVIQHAPSSLEDLIHLTGGQGFDLLKLIKERLNVWKNKKNVLNAFPVIIICFPMVRVAGAEPENQELWAFFINKRVQELGKSLDLWDIHNGNIGSILLANGGSPKKGEDVEVGLLNPHPTLSRESAASFNRIEKAEIPRIVAVGAGALGSQVITNLTRQGWGAWRIIDDDYLFPHNLARHALAGDSVGIPKAVGLVHSLEQILDEGPPPNCLVTDISAHSNEDEKEVSKALNEAELILDMSTSITVARHLSDIEAAARRFSAYLNPAGTDLILLAEDKKRTCSLNELEMLYYWALATNDELHTHLDAPDRVRYARSCRDLSNRIPQTAVAIHAGIAGEAIRRTFKDDSLAIAIWHIDTADYTVNCRRIPVEPMCRLEIADWDISVSEELLQKLIQLRSEKLPNETGGVLLGDCDIERHQIYLVGAFGAPPDSEEWPTHYIRGSRGLRRQVKEVTDRTEDMLRYVGEWHSHPDGAACLPSTDDRQSYAWLANHMRAEGYPPMMIIVGERDNFCFVLGDEKVVLTR